MSIDVVIQKLLSPASRIVYMPGAEYVYMLFSAGEMVYVGTTISLATRVNSHKKAGRIQFDSFSYVQFETHSEAVNVERELIWTLKPVFNRQMTLIEYQGASPEALARKAEKRMLKIARRMEKFAKYKQEPMNFTKEFQEMQEYNQRLSEALERERSAYFEEIFTRIENSK